MKIKILFVALFSSIVAQAEVVVTRSQFIEAMRTSLPNAFCREDQYFRKCFNVTEDDCIREGLRATKTCLLSMESQIPQKLKQPEDGRTWGEKIGQCAGTAYESSLGADKKKLETKDCKDPSKWK